MRYHRLFLLPLLLPLSIAVQAVEFYCPLGDPVSAFLGDGVIMRTCIWRKESGVTVRAGPLQLTRNGIVILELRTNFNGKLHGRYRAWSDAGELTNQGNYHNGLKQGTWLETDLNGIQNTLHYRDGVVISR